jgi:tetratricopeptide (TPR) repeat protein
VNKAQLSKVRANQTLAPKKAVSVPKPILHRRWVLALGAVLLVAIAGLAIAWSFYDRHPDPFTAALGAIDRGNLADARKYLTELKALDQHPSQVRLVRGAILLKKGYYYPALDELQGLTSDADLSTPALTLIGQAWYHLGRHVEAQEALQRVLQKEPNAVDAHRWLAASYYDQGAIHDALRHLQRTIELDPGDARPHRLLGLIYKDYERYEDAVPCYQQSLHLKADQPDADDVRLELATCLVKLRRHREALTTLERCSASAETIALRAECRHALGDLSLAKEALADALARDGNYLDALLLQGTILLEEGNAPEAVEFFRRASRTHPKDYLAHFKLAQAYSQADQKELAEGEQKLADKIRELRKEFADLHQVAWDRPRDVQVRLRLASLANELDRPDLADVWLKSAAALQPLATDHPQTGPHDSTEPKNN